MVINPVHTETIGVVEYSSLRDMPAQQSICGREYCRDTVAAMTEAFFRTDFPVLSKLTLTKCC